MEYKEIVQNTTEQSGEMSTVKDENSQAITGASPVNINTVCKESDIKQKIKKKLGFSNDAEKYIEYSINKILEWCYCYFAKGKLNPSRLHINPMGLCLHLFNNDESVPKLKIIYSDKTMMIAETLCSFNGQKEGSIIIEIVDHWKNYKNLNDEYYTIRSFFDPDNYGFTHEVLDYANNVIKQHFPDRNLWMVCCDFDFMDIIDLDLLPDWKRY